MAQTIEIAGETYSNVPSIDVPLASSGIASFYDISSSTVTASDMLNGVKAYNANGVEVTGTIQSKSSSDVSVSGDTVSIPAGNYSSSVTKTVAAGSATTPATTITLDPTISISSGGLITASYSGSQTVIPTVSPGYISSGVGGTVTVTGSKTSQMTVQAAQTITPTTTNQTISSGTYLTGTQTILGDANLIAANIAKDITIFGVLGTFTGGGSIEMESGEFTPQSDASRPTILFTNTHTLPPSFVYAVYNGFPSATSSNQAFFLIDLLALSGYPMYYSGSSTKAAMYYAYYRGTGTAGGSTSGVITYGRENTGSDSTSYYRYFATPTAIKPYGGSGQRYWRKEHKIYWAAYWL